MSDTVAIAAISALQTILMAVLAYFMRRTSATVGNTHDRMDQLEKNTNNKMDQLIEAKNAQIISSGKEGFTRGVASQQGNDHESK